MTCVGSAGRGAQSASARWKRAGVRARDCCFGRMTAGRQKRQQWLVDGEGLPALCAGRQAEGCAVSRKSSAKERASAGVRKRRQRVRNGRSRGRSDGWACMCFSGCVQDQDASPNKPATSERLDERTSWSRPQIHLTATTSPSHRPDSRRPAQRLARAMLLPRASTAIECSTASPAAQPLLHLGGTRASFPAPVYASHPCTAIWDSMTILLPRQHARGTDRTFEAGVRLMVARLVQSSSLPAATVPSAVIPAPSIEYYRTSQPLRHRPKLPDQRDTAPALRLATLRACSTEPSWHCR